MSTEWRLVALALAWLGWFAGVRNLSAAARPADIGAEERPPFAAMVGFAAVLALGAWVLGVHLTAADWRPSSDAELPVVGATFFDYYGFDFGRPGLVSRGVFWIGALIGSVWVGKAFAMSCWLAFTVATATCLRRVSAPSTAVFALGMIALSSTALGAFSILRAVGLPDAAVMCAAVAAIGRRDRWVFALVGVATLDNPLCVAVWLGYAAFRMWERPAARRELGTTTALWVVALGPSVGQAMMVHSSLVHEVGATAGGGNLAALWMISVALLPWIPAGIRPVFAMATASAGATGVAQYLGFVPNEPRHLLAASALMTVGAATGIDRWFARKFGSAAHLGPLVFIALGWTWSADVGLHWPLEFANPGDRVAVAVALIVAVPHPGFSMVRAAGSLVAGLGLLHAAVGDEVVSADRSLAAIRASPFQGYKLLNLAHPESVHVADAALFRGLAFRSQWMRGGAVVPLEQAVPAEGVGLILTEGGQQIDGWWAGIDGALFESAHCQPVNERHPLHYGLSWCVAEPARDEAPIENPGGD